MLKFVVGENGKGKTKVLLEHANTQAKTDNGLIVYLDKNKKHIYDLDKKIRLCDVSDYCEFNNKTLQGFVCGLVAGNHDINAIYIDGFLTMSDCDFKADLEPIFDEMQEFSNSSNVDFILSVSSNISRIPEKYKGAIIAAL